ncbi:MAG TPA: isoprenylcysteine carboxylmethyltransferase family protein [Ktedonobacteraceae bacterium]|nr:isoprenylcysteine carboxylmethyltransferase family protein [Ktedonobacteraceae bacterium]
MGVDLKKMAGESVVGLVVVAVPLFLAAGTLAWGAGWAFLVLLFGCTGIYTAWMYVKRPELLTERMNVAQKDQKIWDKLFLSLLLLYVVIWLIFMPLDARRFRWTHLPLWLQIIGGVLFVAAFLVYFLTARENPYMASVARVQQERGQTVISTGPYHLVRHPMYSGSLLLFLGIPLLLGSGYGLLFALGGMLLLAWRTVMEERMLRAELAGNEDYMQQVKYRLIPALW